MSISDKVESQEIYAKKWQRWINECSLCHRQGYTPELPDWKDDALDFPLRYNYKRIRQHFQCLELDENGFCLVCSKIIKKRS